MSEFRPPWITDGPVSFRIWGQEIQMTEYLLEPGQRILLQPDAFLASAGGVRALHVSWGRRLLDPVYRVWAREQGILQEVVCEGTPARVLIGASQYGKIVRVSVHPRRALYCQRGAFIAATGSVDIGIALTRRVRAGLFGGQGIVFQKITGEGDVFLHALGATADWTLPRDALIRVSTNNILCFDDTVGYDSQFAGGPMLLLFGGQGLFLSQLEGPGRVIIQSVDHAQLRTNMRGPRVRAPRLRRPGVAIQEGE